MNLPRLNTVILDIENYTGKITLNRPEKKNALNLEMVNDLKTAFDIFENSKEVRIILLQAMGDVFCSGADLAYLKQLQKFSYKENLKDSESLSGLFLKIYFCSKPVIAKVAGAALAGGCGLATVCDFIYASENAIFGYPEVRIGFVAALVSSFLIRQIGERKARDLLLTGRKITAEEAFEIGLINKIISLNEIDSKIEDLIKKLLKNSPNALTSTKKIINEFEYTDAKVQSRILSEVNAKFRSTDEFSEGINSFLEKRNPNWLIN